MLSILVVMTVTIQSVNFLQLIPWRFQPDPDDVGVAETWFASDFDDHDWPLIEAGVRWEEQGFPELDGVAWYRSSFTLPDAWRLKPVWLVVNGINDSAELYCNGTLVNRFGDEDVYFASVAVVADLTPHIVPGENQLTLRVYDAGGSGGLWRLPVGVTNDPAQFPIDSMVALRPSRNEDELLVDVDFVGFGSDTNVARARVQATCPDGTEFESVADLDAAAGTVPVRIIGVASGDELQVRIEPLDAAGNLVARATLATTYVWPAPPGWGAEHADLHVRNNFVTELYTGEVQAGTVTIPFSNPRDGWVFFAWNCIGAAPTVRIGDDTLVWRTNPDTGAYEAMLHFSEGEYSLALDASSSGAIEIRTVPELAFCYYPTDPHIEAFGDYDWAYMERHVLPHVNVLISRSDIDTAEFNRWRDEGRHWVYNASLPGLSGDAPTADAVVDVWKQNPGVVDDGFAGMIVDEFLFNSQDHYDAWTEALRRTHALPSFADKTFYAWCLDLYHHVAAREFQKALIAFDDRFVWESYLPEDPTPELAETRFIREVTQVWSAWKNVIPGIDTRMVMCLGYLSAPPESLNTNPSVDYHVFMDMQFHALATDPAFWNLYGIMEYSASYADEESLRWAHRLFRHYGIEGRTDRLTNDPYITSHIKNPDFVEDLAHWEIEPAEEGSIERGVMEGFSWLQGRYPRTTAGDTFCIFSRSRDKPNLMSQPITGLEPGRLYSVKLISADIDALDQDQRLGLFITVDDAEPFTDLSFQETYPSNYAHLLPPYNAEFSAHFNLHRVVFRATGPSARLAITDWHEDKPAGLIGQRIAFNFVEVQPFR